MKSIMDSFQIIICSCEQRAREVLQWRQVYKWANLFKLRQMISRDAETSTSQLELIVQNRSMFRTKYLKRRTLQQNDSKWRRPFRVPLEFTQSVLNCLPSTTLTRLLNMWIHIQHSQCSDLFQVNDIQFASHYRIYTSNLGLFCSNKFTHRISISSLSSYIKTGWKHRKEMFAKWLHPSILFFFKEVSADLFFLAKCFRMYSTFTLHNTRGGVWINWWDAHHSVISSTRRWLWITSTGN